MPVSWGRAADWGGAMRFCNIAPLPRGPRCCPLSLRPETTSLSQMHHLSRRARPGAHRTQLLPTFFLMVLPPPSSATLRSLSHDVLALERIARLLSRKIWGQLKCEGATSLTSVWWAPVGAGLAWPLAVWVRRKLTNVYARKADKIY